METVQPDAVGAAASAGRSERLARLRLLLGDDGLAALDRSTVMVLGLGGVGSSCAEALARGGIGSLILLDRDVVEASNINRQALAFVSTIGQRKSDAMRAMVADINPECRVVAEQVYLTPEALDAVLDGFPRPDYVIDCIDTVTQKLACYAWCAARSVRLVASMGAANKLDPTFLRFSEVQRTQHCRLSKIIRKECRRRGLSNVEVLSSSELTLDLDRPNSRVKSESLGSMSYMPPIMGQMLAGLVIRRLVGLEPLPAPPTIEPGEV